MTYTTISIPVSPNGPYVVPIIASQVNYYLRLFVYV